MAHFKFAVSGQVLYLLTSTKGIADDLYTNSFEFDFRSPEWATCDMKWAHFYNSDYNKIGPNGEAMPYDFNLVDDAISAERGVNLPYGIWEVFVTGNVILNGDEVVQRFVTETQSIWIVQSGVINAEPLGSIEASEVERLSAMTNAAYNARITAATARIEDPDGDVSASVAINGESGTKQLDFVFTGLNNYNKLYPCAYGTTSYSDVATALSDGLLPYVTLDEQILRSIGYLVAPGTVVSAIYHGEERWYGYIPASDMSTRKDSFLFTAVVNSVYWGISLSREVDLSNEEIIFEGWDLKQNNKLYSVTKYNTVAKKFYNIGSGVEEDIITASRLKTDMAIGSADVSYNPNGTYPAGTIGAYLTDFTGVFWCQYNVTTYSDITSALSNNLLPVLKITRAVEGTTDSRIIRIAPLAYDYFQRPPGPTRKQVFASLFDGSYYVYTCSDPNTWSEEIIPIGNVSQLSYSVVS